MSPLPDFFRRVFLVYLLAVAVQGVPRAAAQPRILPHAALLPHYSPLCDSNLVGCLDIDDFGAHAYAHLMVLPKTDRRDTAAVFPYGVTLGLFGRFAGGVATDFSFWQEGGGVVHQHGPLRLNLTALLWPLFPLSQAPQMTQEDDGATYYRPAHHLRIGVHYEQQLRTGPFNGPNTLGLLSDLAALRVVASRAFGPVEITTSLGALYDWRGAFATGEAAAQIGIYLPFFRALKFYGEALGRGWPAYVKTTDDGVTPVLAALLSPDGVDPIRRQSALGIGLSFRPQARVDFGVSVQMGLGGIAPTTVLVRALVLSVGKTYQGRAATPIAQIAADVTAEVAIRLKEFIANLPVDPKLDENCLILDKDNVTVLGQFGKRSKDGYYCEEDGFRVPIGHEFERDRYKTKLCRDMALQDCILERHGNKWVPIHRPKLDSNCDLFDTDGTYLGRVGKPTEDGERCRYPVQSKNGGYGTSTQYQEQPIGVPFHTDADRSRVCLDANMQSCFLKPQDGRGTLAVEGNERFGKRFDQKLSGDVEKKVDQVKQTGQDLADGKITISTVGDEAKRIAKSAADEARDVAHNPGQIIDGAKHAIDALVKAADDWRKKTPEEKLDDYANAAASVAEQAAMGVAGRAAGLGMGLGRTAGRIEKAGEAIDHSKKARKAAARAAKAEDSVAEHLVPAIPSLPPLATSRAARREAMRKAGIPTSQQPNKQLKTMAGHQYEYEIRVGDQGRTAIVTQQTTDRVAGHGPHWEAGLAKPENKYGRDPLGRLKVENSKSKAEYRP